MSSSIYTIDRKKGIAIENIPDEGSNFLDYFNEVLVKISNDKVKKKFLPKSTHTQVVTSVVNIIELNENSEDNNHLFKELAERLLEKESDVQEIINKMNKEVQVGSLMQSLFYNEELRQYMYVIAKVGHIDFINQRGLYSATGFPKNIKLYKSCIFHFDEQKEVIGAEVHLDTSSKYWYDEFLELRELTTDESNTEKAFSAIDGFLNRVIKRKYPKDRASLRNSFIHHFRQTTMMNYDEMIDNIFDGYNPIDSDFPIEEYQKKLLELPTTKKFERNFQVIQDIIKSRIRTNYNVFSGITMKVSDNREVINAFEEGGKRYLKIEVTDDTTFNEFRYKE